MKMFTEVQLYALLEQAHKAGFARACFWPMPVPEDADSPAAQKEQEEDISKLMKCPSQ